MEFVAVNPSILDDLTTATMWWWQGIPSVYGIPQEQPPNTDPSTISLLKKHLLSLCPHPLLISKCLEIIQALRKKGKKQHIPHSFLDMLENILTDHSQSRVWQNPASHFLLTALAAQSTIGINMCFHSCMATSWTTALGAMGVDRRQRMKMWILRILWFYCIDALWQERNLILHNSHANMHYVYYGFLSVQNVSHIGTITFITSPLWTSHIHPRGHRRSSFVSSLKHNRFTLPNPPNQSNPWPISSPHC